MNKFAILLLLLSTSAFAQEALQQTLSFTISGKIKKESVITMDSLSSYPLKSIGDIKVTNHLGEFKHQDDQLKGVLLKDILSHSELMANSPKLFSRFYFVCVGADGYKVVYSWNELFNTETGNHVFIIMEKNGIKAGKMPESIQMTSITDFKTGRRYLHNLDKIIVGEAN
ncbi:MAG TPA: hypothetical protein VNW95_18040 [Mucilaginibacter sp.]|jgi:hypothetical protein|nr:hypothetical protein [Mucilaginibacter sp.]